MHTPQLLAPFSALEYNAQGHRVQFDFHTGFAAASFIIIRDLKRKIDKTFLWQEESLLGLLEIIKNLYLNLSPSVVPYSRFYAPEPYSRSSHSCFLCWLIQYLTLAEMIVLTSLKKLNPKKIKIFHKISLKTSDFLHLMDFQSLWENF